jgi:hypothetical protein
MGKYLVLAGALLLPLAACGGSDDSSSEPPGDITTQAQAAPDEDSTVDGTVAESGTDSTTPSSEDGDGGGDADGSGPSTATVTIDGETYDFSTEGAVVAQCQTDMFGVFSVQLPMADGDGNVNIVALREGTDPEVVDQVNAVTISVGDEDWIADESNGLFEMSDALEPGMSQVDSVEIDGSTVRGAATFVRQLSVFSGGDVETTTGTFEATCGEERLS